MRLRSQFVIHVRDDQVVGHLAGEHMEGGQESHGIRAAGHGNQKGVAGPNHPMVQKGGFHYRNEVTGCRCRAHGANIIARCTG